jgi:hypothetical protein
MRAIELTIIERASWASSRAWSSAASTRSAAVGAEKELLEAEKELVGAALREVSER